MKKVIVIALILGLLIAGGACFAYYNFTSPVNSSDFSTQTVVIPSGSSAGQIASILYNSGLIKNEMAFRLQLKLDDASDKLQAGQFELSPSQDLKSIIASLQQSPDQVTITILPGWRREEIAQYLNAQGLDNFDEAEFLTLTEDLEGQLSANTFQVYSYVTTQEIATLLTQQFDTDITIKFANLQSQSGKSWNEILTMASILQREARGLEEMRIVAGLLNKRIAEGMPLGLCATLQYCKGQTADGKYWNPPLASYKDLDCEYNTYQNLGLPPAPISTVSPTAVEAALTPEESDYYYYIHGDDGQIHYAATHEEHEANIEAYLK